MSVKKFKFVSPGVFINEIDNSQLPRTPAPQGPTVVGRSLRGPALQPVQVESFDEFIDMFGPPIAGNESVDAFRNAALGATTYGAYAAQAWFDNSSTLNFVRLLGRQDPNYTAASGEAGWKLAGFSNTGGGAYGLFVFNSASLGNHTGTLAAIFYCDSDSYAEVSGTINKDGGAGSTQTAANCLINSTNNEVVVRIVGGSTVESVCNFDRTSRNYIRSVFNTNPTKTNSEVSTVVGDYFLGETFDRAIQEDLGGSSNIKFAMMVPLDGGATADGANFYKSYVDAQAGWVVSQDLSANTGGFDPSNSTRVSNLFKFVGLQTGEYDQGAIKISIDGIRPSKNADDFGTFNVSIRRIDDNDAKVTEVERYNTVNLNPNSPNYIAAKVGNRFVEWNNDERVYKTYGEYENNSRYVRMNMNALVDDSQIEPTLLPYGFYAPTKYKNVAYTSGSALPSTAFLAGSGSLPSGAKPSGLKTSDATAGLSGSDSKGYQYNSVLPGNNYRWVVPASYTGGDAITYVVHIVGGNENLSSSFDTEYECQIQATASSIATRALNLMNASAADALGLAGATTATASLWSTITTYLISAAGTGGEIDVKAVTGGTNGNAIIGSGSAVGICTSWTSGVPSALFAGGTEAPGDLVSGDGSSALLLKMPSIPLRQTTAVGAVSSPAAAYFGLTTTRSSGSTTYDDSIPDFLRTKPTGLDSFGTTTFTEWSHIFTLDDCILASNGAVTYSSGSRAAGTSLTAKSGSYSILTGTVQVKGYTMPLNGGFDGLDITEKDPFANKNMDGQSERSSAAYHSMTVALDSIKDPEVVQTNVLTVPGLTTTSLTDKVLDIADARQDCLAIIDLPGGFTPSSENTNTIQNRVGSVTTTINELNSRALNTSFGCAFYPWVRVRDLFSDTNIWLPPSVPALGAFSYTDKNADPWFAPAGFNRGGLSKGVGGVQVVGVVDRLRSKDRDDLYEVNINPIGTFPNEGVVILGQKTLQTTRSALDRINVRRLLIYTKSQITAVANDILFEQNVQDTWNKFIARTEPILRSIKAGFGLEDYRLILDQTTTTAELRDRNILYAKIFLKPAKSIEFIALDFVITNSAASFE